MVTITDNSLSRGGGTKTYNPQLETFIRVVQAGSFNKAANELYISSTAVTKQINLLESELGVQLFYRTHAGITLTEAGKSLYADAQEIIHHCEKAMLKAKKLNEQEAHTIRIGFHPATNSAQFLIDAWREAGAFAPDLTLKLVELKKINNYAEGLGWRYDVIPLVYSPDQLPEKRYSIFPLGNVPVRLSASITNPLSQKEILTIEDITGHEILLYPRGHIPGFDRIRDMLEDLYGDRIHFRELPLNCTHDEANEPLEAGALVLTIDYWYPSHMMQNLLPVDWQLTVPVGLMALPNRPEKVQCFLDAVGKAFMP